jgi:hypothetical protein
MMRMEYAVLAAAMMAAIATPAAAEVLDAVYRGTLVCDKLPFNSARMREAIEVTITGGAARYNHVLERRRPPVRREIQWHVRAAQRPPQGHADLD